MKKYIAIIAAALIFTSCGTTTESQSGSDITTTTAGVSVTENAAETDKTSDSTSQSKTESQSGTVGSSGISATEGEAPKAAEATVSAAVTPAPQTQAPVTKPETKAPETQATTKPVTKATTKAVTKATTKATQKPVTTTAATTAKEVVVSDSDFADEVIRLINIERENGGLEPLVKDEILTSAALVRAVEIDENFSHTRPNGSSPFTAIAEAGGPFRTMGENIAYGYPTPESVVEGWMNSEGHRANIMNADFKYIGVGYYKGSSHDWTQFFGG